MVKEESCLEDGRRILYYSFEDEKAEDEKSCQMIEPKKEEGSK